MGRMNNIYITIFVWASFAYAAVMIVGGTIVYIKSLFECNHFWLYKRDEEGAFLSKVCLYCKKGKEYV